MLYNQSSFSIPMFETASVIENLEERKKSNNTMPEDYYQREYVQQMQKIFGYPRAPLTVTQQPLDGGPDVYHALIKKEWHEIGRDDWWYFLNDLKFVKHLQQELFDFVFPAFLIIWREGLEKRIYQPSTESELFGAIRFGQIFERMMDLQRQAEVANWIVEAFCSNVETISASDIDASNVRNEALHFFLWTFNGIGQSAPILGEIIHRIGNTTTPGRARFWLVLATGLCYAENTGPWICPWTPNAGGGGIYLLESWAELYDYGYVEKNLDDYRAFLTLERVQILLFGMKNVSLTEKEQEIVQACLRRTISHEIGVRKKIEWYLHNLGEAKLGIFEDEPDFFGKVI